MFKTISVIFFLIFLTFSSLYIFFNEGNYFNQSISDHFNGKNFFNPEEKNLPKKTSFLSYYLNKLKYQKQHGKTKWLEKNQIIEQLIPLEYVNDKSIHATFIGHSTFLLQFQGLNILTDPIFSERASPFNFIGPKRAVIPGIKYEKLPNIDLVLISHSHYDHLDIPTIIKLHNDYQPKFITGLGNCYYLNQIKKLKLNCTELDWNEGLKVFDKITVNFLPAKHWSKRMMFGRNASLWGAFAIESSLGNIYFAGDTGYSDHFINAKIKFSSFKLAMIPIGAYKPEDFMLRYHLSPTQAVKAHIELNSQKSIAMHHSTFQLSSENYNDPINDLELAKKDKKITNDFIALEIGKKIIIK